MAYIYKAKKTIEPLKLMKLNIDIDNITLDILSARLKNVVKPLDIIKWLGNFEPKELDYAKDIISNLTVYTTYEIEEILSDSFGMLFENIASDEKIIVNPIGEFGKSGSMVTYFFQKTQFFKRHNSKIELLPTLDNIKFVKDKKYTLVLLDDFVGSGNTIETYYTSNLIKLKSKFKKIFFVGIAGMEKGIERINPLFNEVKVPQSNIFRCAFSSKGSLFGYRKYSEHRKFAYKYGKALTSPSKNKKGKVLKDSQGNPKFLDALGYENSQALVSFAYGSPNNTLPIIWANRDNWFPLIPRFSVDKISSARNFRKNILHELSILKEFGSENIKDNFFSLEIKKGNRTFTSVNRIDFSIYSIIKLTRAGFVPINICQKLGILYKDYEGYLQQGKERGIFEVDNRLTLFGLELYSDARKCIEKRRRTFENELKEHYTIKEINYLPKKFNGRS
ncbi:MAG: hypothetical protein A2X12_05035 [Bacteroidetes bacterium GWE2_29_8]|nr:MAG: hypothetical protein A2X12_05035 [Bacteroidetes bacterium GWE2_29_8]